MRSRVLETVKSWPLTKFLAGIVLVHNLAQALPWLATIVASVGAGAYAAAKQSPILLGAAAALGAASALVLFVNFLILYLERRRKGWKQRATTSEEMLGGQQVLVGKAERLALALTLIRDLNLSPLEIVDPRLRDELTKEWLTRHMMPAMARISPGVGIGLLEWEWVEAHKGEYRLGYDSGVPEVVRSVLPKQTNRDFITCLAILQLRDHRASAISDEVGRSLKTWLVAFPEKKFDLAAEAVFSTGVRIITDAWRDPDPLPVAMPA